MEKKRDERRKTKWKDTREGRKRDKKKAARNQKISIRKKKKRAVTYILHFVGHDGHPVKSHEEENGHRCCIQLNSLTSFLSMIDYCPFIKIKKTLMNRSKKINKINC
jgi:hypothetical protein